MGTLIYLILGPCSSPRMKKRKRTYTCRENSSEPREHSTKTIHSAGLEERRGEQGRRAPRPGAHQGADGQDQRSAARRAPGVRWRFEANAESSRCLGPEKIVWRHLFILSISAALEDLKGYDFYKRRAYLPGGQNNRVRRVVRNPGQLCGRRCRQR